MSIPAGVFSYHWIQILLHWIPPLPPFVTQLQRVGEKPGLVSATKPYLLKLANGTNTRKYNKLVEDTNIQQIIGSVEISPLNHY